MTTAGPPGPNTETTSAEAKPPTSGKGRFLLPAILIIAGLAGFIFLRPASVPDTKEPSAAPTTQPLAADQVRQAENLFQLGLVAAEQGQVDEAMLRFVEALHLNPQHPQARGALGALLEERGRYQEAAEHLRQDLENHPKNYRSHYYLGLCYSKRFELSEAIEHYRAAAELAPEFIPARYNLALALTYLGQKDDAIDEFEKILDILPRLSNADRGTYEARTQNGLADALYRHGKPDEARAHAEAALKADPNLVEPHLLLGEIALAQQRTDEARQHCEKALALNPQDERARVLFRSLTGEEGRVEEPSSAPQTPGQVELIADAQERLKGDPENPELHNRLGILLARAGRLEEARGHLEEAMRLSPEDVAVHINLAGVYHSEGEPEQAERYYRQAVALDPTNLVANLALSQFLCEAGRYAEAADTGREVLKKTPDQPILRGEVAWLLATCPDDEVRNGIEAVALAEPLKEMWGQSGSPAQGGARTFDILAACYAEAGRFEQAAATAEQALELAREARENRLATRIEARLHLYQQGKPYRETRSPAAGQPGPD
jgi:tetratricopeptide (TPR) repeat protein